MKTTTIIFAGVKVGSVESTLLDNTTLYSFDYREDLLQAFEKGFMLASKGYNYTISEHRDEIILVKTPSRGY